MATKLKTATLEDINKALTSQGYIQISKSFDFTKAKKNTYYFIPPASARGTEFLLYLPESYTKQQRPKFLQDLAKKFVSIRGVFKTTHANSSRPAVAFTGTNFYINAKMVAGKQPGANKGNAFEDVLLADFQTYIERGCPFNSKNYKYPKFIEEFTNMIAPEKIKTVRKVGQENTPRPLGLTGDQLYVSVRGGARQTKIGAALSDIDVVTNKRTIHLSLKFGTTVTFMNAGVGKIFPKDKFEKNSDASFDDMPMAMAIFKTFGIDPVKFRKVFTDYVEPAPGQKKTKAPKEIKFFKADKLKMENLIKTAIGYDYMLCHLDNKGEIHIQNMTEQYLRQAAALTTEKVQINYPIGGSAKRVDMIVETKKFTLKWNIRNKQAGRYPTHIMCDYVMK